MRSKKRKSSNRSVERLELFDVYFRIPEEFRVTSVIFFHLIFLSATQNELILSKRLNMSACVWCQGSKATMNEFSLISGASTSKKHSIFKQ